MGSLKPGATYIYERVDNTVYAREIGAAPLGSEIVAAHPSPFLSYPAFFLSSSWLDVPWKLMCKPLCRIAKSGEWHLLTLDLRTQNRFLFQKMLISSTVMSDVKLHWDSLTAQTPYLPHRSHLCRGKTRTPELSSDDV